MTPDKAHELARRMSPLDTAALLMSATHVAARLRELAEIAREGTAHGAWMSSRLDALAAQLAAGVTARPAATVLRLWAEAVEADLVTEGGAS